MHLNTDPVAPAAPAKKPCWRDLHELTTKHLNPALVTLVPLSELERRLSEIEAEHPHLVEETPIVWQHETRRRARFQQLQVVGRRPLAESPVLQGYSRA
ncbi:hypothetical protein [Hymenobacter convexus]|uniref:hypothetical protein n=1 Tax=Hymenobacter sp. CA1UV-4 TaxID=3063782 RepID=UPI002714231A|nr:hypothetical protein [Hymenobacter sp. CA1UV-4]MDO7851592.1 hypothetical protein [Hymenobacter sp. CA1UV-4]